MYNVISLSPGHLPFGQNNGNCSGRISTFDSFPLRSMSATCRFVMTTHTCTVFGLCSDRQRNWGWKSRFSETAREFSHQLTSRKHLVVVNLVDRAFRVVELSMFPVVIAFEWCYIGVNGIREWQLFSVYYLQVLHKIPIGSMVLFLQLATFWACFWPTFWAGWPLTKFEWNKGSSDSYEY